MKKVNDKDMEKLFDRMNPRTKPSKATRDQVYNEVHSMWLRTHKKPFFQTHIIKIAASVLLFVFLFSFNLFNKDSQPGLNMVENIQMLGQAQLSQDNKKWHNLDYNKKLSSGDYIRTRQNDRLLVKLLNGNKFRVDENTLFRIDATDQLALIHGRIYVDSHNESGHQKLTIDTKFAQVNHVGTRYAVSYINDLLNVAVRSGLVIVSRSDVSNSEIKQGNEFLLNAKGDFEYKNIDAFDPKWAWTQKIAENFIIQGKTVLEYLNWVSAETGYSINWSSDKIKAKAKNVSLSGSINGILPLNSLEVVIPTTRFSYSLDNNQIYIHSVKSYNK
ncbi:MAG: FecR family protein [Proteobacteria bacterium]|nr:FecR family protein [Pseudomonadota bacterium]